VRQEQLTDLEVQLSELRQQMIDERNAIEAMLREAAASGQPLSLLEQGRIDERVARIKDLAGKLQVLEQAVTTA
jgi:hypothetical protein